MDHDQTEMSRTETMDKTVLQKLEKLGRGSSFLWIIFIFTLTPTMFNGMHSMSYIFIAEVPTHWCSIPELTAANWSDEQIRNISSATSCTKYDFNYTHFAKIGFERALENKISNELPSTSECKIRSFADDIDGTSIVQDWDLVCEKTADRSSTHMALSLGKLMGSAFFGIFADKYGRKISYAIGIIMLIISGPASAILPWYWGFMITRYLSGASHAAIQYTSFTTLTEVAGEKHRQWMGVIYNAGYATGIALLAGIAYLIHDWRQIQLAISLPALFLLIHMWFMPESPRWLISQNRHKEARRLIEKAYGNMCEATTTTALTTTLPTYALKDSDDPVISKRLPTIETSTKERLRKNIKGLGLILRNNELRKRILITNFAWMTASLSYYALALNVNNFPANRYIYVLVMGLTEIPAYMIPTPILMVLGRRSASGILYTVSAIFLLCILMIPQTESTTIMVTALIGRFILSAVYSIVILYSSELFPTVSRNSAVGTNSAMSHVGSVAAPYVADLMGALVWWGPTTLCGAMALLAGLLCSMLPETSGRSLANTPEEEITEERGSVSLSNCCKCGR